MAVKDTSVLYSAKGRIIVDTDQKEVFVKAGFYEEEPKAKTSKKKEELLVNDKKD